MTNALKMLMEPSGIVVIPLILCSVIAVAVVLGSSALVRRLGGAGGGRP